MTTIKLKNGSGAPTSGDLVQGEPALDLTNKRLYTEDSGGTVIEVGTNPTSITTGTVTADGLTVNDVSANPVTFLRTTSSSEQLELSVDDSGVIFNSYQDEGGRYGGFTFQGTENGVGTRTRLRIFESTGDIAFYEDTGTTAKLFWDASTERLGIGTTNPSASLEVDGVTNSTYLIVGGDDSSNGRALTFTSSASASFNGAVHTINAPSSQGVIALATGGSEAMRIDSSGALGLGTTPPSTSTHSQMFIGNESVILGSSSGALDIGNNLYYNSGWKYRTTGAVTLQDFSASGNIVFYRAASGTANTDVTLEESMRIDPNGNVGIGMTPSGALSIRPSGTGSEDTHFGFGANLDAYITTGSSGIVIFREGDGAGNNSERMRLDSSGNLLVGRDSVSYSGVDLHVGDTSDGQNGLQIQTSTTGYGHVLFGDGTGSDAYAGQITYKHGDNYMSFHTAGSEAMRIDSSGFLQIGTTGKTGRINLQPNPSNNHFVEFYTTADGKVGEINTTGGTTTNYVTSSDQRLKENIVDAPSASDDIDAIQVRSFDWKATGSHQKYGMVAQELNTVAPEAVSAPEDPEDMMGVDYSKLVPMMLKEIQSLRARVAQLEGEA